MAAANNPPAAINAEQDDEEYDEAAMIEAAIKLSMAEEGKPEEKPAAE